MLVCITGMGGTGKSTFARKLCQMNNKCFHYELDNVRQEVLTFDKLKQEFIFIYGSKLLTNGDFDKKKLFGIAFTNNKDFELINSIIIKYMYFIIDDFLTTNKDKIVLLDWFLLDKTKYFNACEPKILMIADKEIRYTRIEKRDGTSIEKIRKIDAVTSNYHYDEFDYIISTNEKISKKLIKKLLNNKNDNKNNRFK